MERKRRVFGCAGRMLTAFFLCILLSGCTKKHTPVVIEETALAELLEEEPEGDSLAAAGGDTPAGTVSGSSEEGFPAQTPDIIYVHVCGAVVTEGVYALEAGGRVYEALEAAGGFLPEADTTFVNLADTLTDGSRVFIPTLEETSGKDKSALLQSSAGSAGAVVSVSDGKVNLNTASKEELKTLNGIGDVYAQAIITYREQHGAFTAIEDVMKVSGIKTKLFERIRDGITV